MDPRRILIAVAAALILSGCAIQRPASSTPGATAPSLAAAVVVEPPAPAPAQAATPAQAASAGALRGVDDRAVSPAPSPANDGARPCRVDPAPERPARSGRAAIAAANLAALTPSRADAFRGGVQVFAWAPGRVYEVWTAPLRVTTLSLAPGEALVAKAAGDTVRWQIGETASGTGAARTVHVLLKPLERGLETNLVLTTDRRVYLLELRSGPPDAFNAAVAWDGDAIGPEAAEMAAAPPRSPSSAAMPTGEPDGRYTIEPQGRRPRWTPTAVFNDGLRTFISFDPDLQVDEAPVLLAIAPDGEAQIVNYRQVGGLFVVDRVLERAELRLGDRRPQIVRIRHRPGGRP